MKTRNGTETVYQYKNGKEITELDIYNALKEINEFLCAVKEDKLLNAHQIKMLLKYNSTIADFTNHFFNEILTLLESKKGAPN